MIRVFFTNLGWFSDKEFETLDEARAYAREKCFDVTFMKDGNVIASWGIIGGFKEYC